MILHNDLIVVQVLHMPHVLLVSVNRKEPELMEGPNAGNQSVVEEADLVELAHVLIF